MAVCNDNFVVLTIPKCGGSWLRAAMNHVGIEWWEEGGEHGHPQNKPGRPHLAILRDPVEWLRSYFTFALTHAVRAFPEVDHLLPDWDAWKVHDKLPADLASLPDRTHRRSADPEALDLFLGKVCEKRPGCVSELFLAYTKPYEVRDLEVADIGTLATSSADFLDRAGEAFDREEFLGYPPFNVTENKPAVRRLRAADIHVAEVEAMTKWGRKLGWFTADRRSR